MKLLLPSEFAFTDVVAGFPPLEQLIHNELPLSVAIPHLLLILCNDFLKHFLQIEILSSLTVKPKSEDHLIHNKNYGIGVSRCHSIKPYRIVYDKDDCSVKESQVPILSN